MPDADLSLAILNGASSDPLTDRALAALGASNAIQAPPGPNNPYDQFDTAPGAAPPAAMGMPSGNPYDQFDTAPGADSLTVRALSMLNASPDDLRRMAQAQPQRPSLPMHVVHGAVGALAAIPGKPVDVTTEAANMAPYFAGVPTDMGVPIDWSGQAPTPGSLPPSLPNNLPGSSRYFQEQVGNATGLGPAAVPPTNTGERVAQAIGAGLVATGVPFAAGKAMGPAGEFFTAGPKNPILGAGANALVGASAGGGGALAQEIVPDSLKPAASLLAPLVAGGAVAGAMGLGQGALRYGAKKIEDFRMPGQMAKAGEEGLASGAIPKAAPGGPDDVATFFTDRLNAAEDQHDRDILQATQQAKESADALGAPKSAQEIGKSMQGILDDAATKEKAAASKLYQAVDPDGTLTVPATPLREQVGAIQKDIPQLAKPPSGEEAAIYNDVSNIGDSVPFSEVQALRSRVSNAIHQEVMASGGESPALRRLTQIKAAINDSLAQGAAKAAANDPAVAARLKADAGAYKEGVGPQTAADIARSYRSSPATLRAAAASGDPLVSDILGVADAGNVGTTSAPLSSVHGGPGQGPGRPGNLSGSPQIPAGQQSLSEALDRLAAANQKYAEYKQTFRSGPVGKVLAPGPSKGTFATPESAVPGKLTGTPEQIAAFEKAAGGRDKAIPLVHEQLASTIPRSADGTIDAGRFPAWLDKTSKTGVLEAYPELKPRFQDAAKAAEQVADANAQRLMAQRAHQKSAASLLTQGTDPVAAVGRALSSNKAEANMRELATVRKSMRRMLDEEAGLVDGRVSR